LAAGLCPEPLGELTALPQTPYSWIKGVGPPGSGGKEGEKGQGKRRRVKWGKGKNEKGEGIGQGREEKGRVLPWLK